MYTQVRQQRQHPSHYMSLSLLKGFHEVLRPIILRAKCVMVQNKNKMVKALASALMILTALAAVNGLSPKSTIKTRPIITNKGAPGADAEFEP
jgi:phage terminase small subunit